jgi:hypothetical protein
MIHKLLPILACCAALLGFAPRGSALTLSVGGGGAPPACAHPASAGLWVWGFLHPWAADLPEGDNDLLSSLSSPPDFRPESSGAPAGPSPPHPRLLDLRSALLRALSSLFSQGCSGSPPRSGQDGPTQTGLLAYQIVAPPEVGERRPREPNGFAVTTFVAGVFRPPRRHWRRSGVPRLA